MFNIPSFFGFRAGDSVSLPLLDIYPNASAAYSLRLLRTAYTGFAIQVRRTDLAVQNIGFDALGELDTAALLAFTGTGASDNGFITEWFDQSGNANNAIQTLAINQPQIVSSGSLILQNSKPIIKFSVTNELNITPINRNELDSSFFMTYKKSTIGDNDVFVKDGVNYLWLSRGSAQFYGNTLVSDNDFDATDYMLVGATMDYNVKLNFYKNNILQISGTTTFGGGQQVSKIFSFMFLRKESFSNEIIIYPTDQDSNASGIQTNMNDFYGIY
jgi:hypothetical protein